MLPSTAPNEIPTGLGAVIDPTTGAFSYPWYCDYLPALFTGQPCAPATPAQIAASAAGDLAGSAATAANQQAIANSVLDNISDDCSGANGTQAQSECQAYMVTQTCPVTASTVGTGAIVQTLCNMGLPDGAIPWMLLAVVAGGIYLVAKKVG